MTLVIASIAFALFVWWASTGLIVYGVVNYERYHGPIVALAAVSAALGMAALIISSDMPTVVGAWVAFSASIVIWGFFEVAFLTGALAGPERAPCPHGLSGFSRFVRAARTVLHHDLAIVATLGVLAYGLSGAINKVGLATFGLLWVMRLSVKLILFFGARHALSDLMPERLAYLQSYFRTDRTTVLFPFVMAAALCALLVTLLSAANAEGAFATTAHTLIATFLVLAIAEHFVLVLPVRDSILWGWAKVSGGGRPVRFPDQFHDQETEGTVPVTVLSGGHHV